MLAASVNVRKTLPSVLTFLTGWNLERMEYGFNDVWIIPKVGVGLGLPALVNTFVKST